GAWRAPCPPACDRASDPSFRDLLPLDALEERAEVTGAEAQVALPLDDLEEEGPAAHVLEERGAFLHEDLKQIRVILVAVHQDLQFAQDVDVLVDLVDPHPPDALGQDIVVG